MLGVSHAVEVLVLGLLVVVYKIPYSSCIFNAAVVLEPGTMVCAILLSIWYTVVACVILMVSIDVVDIGSEYFVVYLSCVYRCSAGYLLFCCISFNAWYITCCPKREALEIYTA